MTTVRERGDADPGQPGPPAAAAWPPVRVTRTQITAFVVVAVVYAVYTLLVLRASPVTDFDDYIYDIHFRRLVLPTPVYDFLLDFVYFGQRGVATFVFLPYFIWMAWRTRSARPMVMLVVALLLLNLSVGAVKLTVGRIGPRLTSDVLHLHMGGDIYPSGHASNVVILYGLMAWISLRHRKLLIGITIWLSVTVGISAVMVNTHWFSDMFGGWLAGILVLLALPFFEGPAERLVDRVYRRRVKPRTDPWVARAEARWPRLAEPGPMPTGRRG